MDVRYYMMNDHQETNELIEKLISQSRQSSNTMLNSIDSMLRRHIFIEETILFPKLPPEMVEDVQYLEKEHGEVFKVLDSISSCVDERQLQKLLRELLDLLLEHNSYEESFIYDYYQNEEASTLTEFVSPPKQWKCRALADR
jgi:hemerythrin superfamily protein